jgi:hypothetical protein
VLEAGENIVITGLGTEGNPFVITGEPSGAAPGEDLAVWSSLGELVVGAGLSRFLFPFDATILGVTASAGAAPTGEDIILDVNKNGTTVFTTQANRPTIPDGTYAATETVPDVVAIVEGDYLTMDRDQIGSTYPGAEVNVFVRYLRSP